MQGKSDPNRELLDAAALCGQLVPVGSVEAFLADHRGVLFGDELFADLFPSGRGRPSIPADVIADLRGGRVGRRADWCVARQVASGVGFNVA